MIKAPTRPLLRSLIVTSVVLSIGVLPASAIVRRTAEDLDSRIIRPIQFLQLPHQVAAGDIGPAADAVAPFRGRHPGEWRTTFDRRTGRLALMTGRGVPLLPGRGNGLIAATLGLPAGPFGMAEAEPLARAFIDGEAGLLHPVSGELRLNAERSGSYDDGRIWYFDYDWFIDGIPVEGARVFLRVNHGNIVQFGTERIAAGRIPAGATLDATAAFDRVFDHAGGRSDNDVVVDPGKLLFLPLPSESTSVSWGGGIAYRLVWRVAFRRGTSVPTWTAEVDARSGELLSFYDANRYARVTGGIYPRTVNDPEEERPFTGVHVTHGGVRIDTGASGTYTYAGGESLHRH